MRTSNSSPTWRVGSLTYSRGGLAALFGWLLWGDFAWSVRERAIPPVMQLLFKKYGASDMLTGLLFASLPAALGLIIGPIVGYKSDRLRTRWGRRIPFLLFTTPFIVFAVVGLAFCPQLGGFYHHFMGANSPGIGTSVLIFLGLFWTLFEISVVTAYSMFGALVNDVVPPEVVGRFFGMFRAVNLLAGIIFFYSLLGDAESHFSWIFLGVGIVYAFGFTLMCFNVREGNYPPPPEASGPNGSALNSIKVYFKDGFGQPYYLWFFAATILGNLASGPFNLYAVYYAKSVSMDIGTFGKYLALTYFCSLALSYPLGILADRFHPLRVSAVVVAFYGATMICGYLFVHDTRTFAFAMVTHGVLSGTFTTSSASLAQRLLPRAKFAEIGSAGGILGGLAGIFLAPLVGTYLDYRHHDYRYTFFVGFLLSALALAAFLVLHSKFMALGGLKHYVAPG